MEKLGDLEMSDILFKKFMEEYKKQLLKKEMGIFILNRDQLNLIVFALKEFKTYAIKSEQTILEFESKNSENYQLIRLVTRSLGFLIGWIELEYKKCFGESVQPVFNKRFLKKWDEFNEETKS